ncbi:MAG: hypothetical protein QGH90_02175, partial [Candidatus Poseidoniaceae archaeon]|nr:hypothetical protein [Candidatus Poseidoniaceae archaeon]
MSEHCGVFMVLSVLLIMPWSGVYAATPDNITIDGDISEWDSDTLIDTSSHSVPSFRITWDETFLFIAWSGTDWSSTSEGADFFVYLNTTSGGSPLSKDWNSVHTLPFSADFAFILEDSSYYSLQTYDGAEWVDADQTGV